MTNLNFSCSTFVIATLFGLGALGFSSFSAQAGATADLGKCRAFTKEKVVSCCNHIIKFEKKPMWMLETESSCQSVVKCAPKKTPATYVAKPRCYVEVQFTPNGGSSGPDSPNTQPIQRLPTSVGKQ